MQTATNQVNVDRHMYHMQKKFYSLALRASNSEDEPGIFKEIGNVPLAVAFEIFDLGYDAGATENANSSEDT